jgi:hypothetical protein
MQDRYVTRQTGILDRWCVLDTHSDAVVFRGEDMVVATKMMREILERQKGRKVAGDDRVFPISKMTEDEARAMARRLNDAYRRSVRDE